ncbi:hypothetical protein DVY24_11690 [Enterococcus faecium]|nr:hypothetical protein DVY24_11690 [Enterococcus faecium]
MAIFQGSREIKQASLTIGIIFFSKIVATFFLSTIIILQFYLSFFRVNEFANSCAFDKEPKNIHARTTNLLKRFIKIFIIRFLQFTFLFTQNK